MVRQGLAGNLDSMIYMDPDRVNRDYLTVILKLTSQK
jgi:hypothetical protein